jgi:16S rRNA (uracil1498-N3)-methyltransferase
MSLPVHWVESLDGVRTGDRVAVGGDEAHHAVAVRRMRVGEAVVLTDGRGTAVTGARGGDGQAPPRGGRGRRSEAVPEPTLEVTVVQALPKGDRGELAVELLTEIGAARVVPWAAARSVAVWRGERAERRRLARWRADRARGRQAGAPRVVPRGAAWRTTTRSPPWWSRATWPWCCTRRPSIGVAAVAVPETALVLVVVGPRAGSDDAELAALRDGRCARRTPGRRGAADVDGRVAAVACAAGPHAALGPAGACLSRVAG